MTKRFSPPCAPLPTRSVVVDGRRFVDVAGRQLILHGINTGGNNKTTPRSWLDAECYARMRAWGLNVVRLQLDWSEIEPVCGKYSEEYLKQVDTQIDYAKRNGLYVFLDMHQIAVADLTTRSSAEPTMPSALDTSEKFTSAVLNSRGSSVKSVTL